MEKHNVSRLVGAPPGYVGYEEGGQLTERIRRRPYAVVLLDEIEKAHPDVFNMLLQIMEEGRLTDSFGRHVDFKNTILIMTSNIGADKITHQATFGFERRDENVSYERMKEMLKTEVERYFRPEFLNRVDELVVFHKLNHEDLTRIVSLEVAKVGKRLVQYGLTLELTDEAIEYLIEKGTDEKFGARPLRRAIEGKIEDPLSEKILRGEFRGKDKVIVKLIGEEGDRKLDFEAVKTEGEAVGAGADTAEAT
jgi:ATP-dependent Clp protease ATP-binding subunit ClpC